MQVENSRGGGDIQDGVLWAEDGGAQRAGGTRDVDFLVGDCGFVAFEGVFESEVRGQVVPIDAAFFEGADVHGWDCLVDGGEGGVEGWAGD